MGLGGGRWSCCTGTFRKLKDAAKARPVSQSRLGTTQSEQGAGMGPDESEERDEEPQVETCQQDGHGRSECQMMLPVGGTAVAAAWVWYAVGRRLPGCHHGLHAGRAWMLQSALWRRHGIWRRPCWVGVARARGHHAGVAQGCVAVHVVRRCSARVGHRTTTHGARGWSQAAVGCTRRRDASALGHAMRYRVLSSQHVAVARSWHGLTPLRHAHCTGACWARKILAGRRIGRRRIACARHGIGRHGLARHRIGRHGLARHGLARHGIATWKRPCRHVRQAAAAVGFGRPRE
jgi:hypothetical protein